MHFRQGSAAIVSAVLLSACAGFHTPLRQAYYLSVENACQETIRVESRNGDFAQETIIPPGQTRVVLPLMSTETEMNGCGQGFPFSNGTFTFHYGDGEKRIISYKAFCQEVGKMGRVTGRDRIFRTCDKPI